MLNFENKKMIKILNNITVVPLERLSGGFSKEYISPNGKYKACVRPVKNPQTGKDESEIIFKTKKGETLFKKNTSEDFEDSFFVARARWTPDSRYFVYSLFNSCGHYNNHFPTFFISTDKVVRKADSKYFIYNSSEPDNQPPWHFPVFSILTYNLKPLSLDHRIGRVVNPEFRVCSPDIVKTVAMCETIKDQCYCEVSLSDMMK